MKRETIKKCAITFGVFALFLAADVITKRLVEAHIGLHERVDVIGSFFQLTLLYNKGGVFGILQGHQVFFLVVSFVVLALLIVFYIFEKNKNLPFVIAMGLVFSGAMGNILDRLEGKPGVVDFIYIGDDRFYRWPAFNVADIAIVIGAVLLLVGFYLQEKRSKKKS
jgi:signal peptidase II